MHLDINVRLVIYGGRDYNDWPRFEASVRRFIMTVLAGFTVTIIEGEARGVDTMARRYAELHGHEYLPFPANWLKYGNSAGYVRNGEMMGIAHYALGFHDGSSRGTAHSNTLAMNKGIPVWVVHY